MFEESDINKAIYIYPVHGLPYYALIVGKDEILVGDGSVEDKTRYSRYRLGTFHRWKFAPEKNPSDFGLVWNEDLKVWE